MDRRGFFSKLFGLNKMPETIFFAVQVVIGAYIKDDLRAELHRVIAQGPEEESPRQKKEYYKKISSLLLECFPAIEFGYWDYIANASDAEAEFHSWVNEIEASMATQAEEMGEEIDVMHRISAEKNYVVVSSVFLLEGDAHIKDFVSIIDSIREDELFHKITFKKLIESVNYIDFEYSFGDATYIMPGNQEDGLSWEDIHSEGWEYLKPLV